MYDLIGDIHGCAGALEALRAKMGYREQDGVWRHPTHQVIFLGDFIDRGPEQVEVMKVVRAMVDAEQALSVMGNHELNAVAWATPISTGSGDYLRPHRPRSSRRSRTSRRPSISCRATTGTSRCSSAITG